MTSATGGIAADALAQVRRTNRLLTQRVGALQDGYLARGRSLGASRLLWEVGAREKGEDVRSLRDRLGLDSGYVSRLLRSLEGEGLVTVTPSSVDRRVRVVSLTAAGRRERRLLDQRSDAVAASMLEPLQGGQRDRLVAAMAELERLLTASMVEVRAVDPAGPDAQHCLAAYYQELDRRFQAGYDPEQGLPVDPEEMRAPPGVFLVAYLLGKAVGCGGLRLPSAHQEMDQATRPAEVKRMWVDPEHRGLGVGRRLLRELEGAARERGATALRLETNEALAEAIAMYEADGFLRVPAFNDERHATHWFEKRL